MSTPINTSVVQFQELPAIAAGAPEILQRNNNQLAVAIDRGNFLLDTIDAEGMTPEIDADCNQFLANCTAAVGKMNDRRKPITQMLTAIASEFTRLENELDKKKIGTIPYRIQQKRDELARSIAQEQQRKQAELKRQQQVETEKIDIRSKVELKLRESFNEILYAGKRKLNDMFNSITLENIESIRADIGKVGVTYPQSKFNEIEVTATSVYLSAEDRANVIYGVREQIYPELSVMWRENMEELKMSLLDQMPARKRELQDMAQASKAEQKRLQEAAEKRQREEQERLDREQLERERHAEELAQQTKEMGQAEMAFNNDVAHVEIMSEQTASVKYSYIIRVITPAGWMQIINLWFREFGSKTAIDKIGNKKPDSMKADLEKLAFNNGPRLDDSAHLVYEQDVKALTRRA